MGVVVEALHEGVELLVHHRVIRDVAIEVVELGLGREVTVEQQVGHFEKRGLLGQLFDRVPAVAQNALAAIDERDVTLATGGHAVAGVVGEVPQFLVQATDVEGRIPFTAGDDREFEVLAGFRIVQGQLAFRHDGTPCVRDSRVQMPRAGGYRPFGRLRGLGLRSARTFGTVWRKYRTSARSAEDQSVPDEPAGPINTPPSSTRPTPVQRSRRERALIRPGERPAIGSLDGWIPSARRA